MPAETRCIHHQRIAFPSADGPNLLSLTKPGNYLEIAETQGGGNCDNGRDLMPSDAATAIAYVGAFVGLVGGGVALFNSWKAVCWKRAELANNYLDFNNNPELVFAGHCLDWNGGKLVLPESLRPYMPDGAQFIQHDRHVFATSLRPDLQLSEMDDDPRIQIYRTSMDSFLSWLSLVASTLDRKLLLVADLQDVGYWVAKIQSEVVLHPFIVVYG
jgi:hypothetical protein